MRIESVPKIILKIYWNKEGEDQLSPSKVTPVFDNELNKVTFDGPKKQCIQFRLAALANKVSKFIMVIATLAFVVSYIILALSYINT